LLIRENSALPGHHPDRAHRPAVSRRAGPAGAAQTRPRLRVPCARRPARAYRRGRRAPRQGAPQADPSM